MTSAVTLSLRQTTIMQYLVGGITVKEISIVLGLSSATVRKHVNKAKKKLGAITHDQAIALIVARGDVTVLIIQPEVTEQ